MTATQPPLPERIEIELFAMIDEVDWDDKEAYGQETRNLVDKILHQINALLNEAKVDELKFLDDFLSEEYQHEFDTKQYLKDRIKQLNKEK